MKEYQAFLEAYKIADTSVQTTDKLEKEKFNDDSAEEDAQKYIEQISSTLEILGHNLKVEIDSISDTSEVDKSVQEKITQYAQSIYKLSHLEVFNIYFQFNTEEILSALVEAMPLTTQKNSIFVDLSQ